MVGAKGGIMMCWKKVDGQGRALPCANAGWTMEGIMKWWMEKGGHHVQIKKVDG